MKTISGHTVPFAVLGHPIGHSLSPAMHNASISKLGIDAVYLAFDVHPDSLMQVLTAMKEMGFRGVNLTVPLKEVAFRGLTILDDSARIMGAVNTVEFLGDGSLKGHNTDGAGFLEAVRESFNISLAGQNLLVIGTGGAGRAVAIASAIAGCSSIALADLDTSRTDSLIREISEYAPSCRARVCSTNIEEEARHASLVIQATPVGMKAEDKPLLSSSAFRPGQFVYDLIYMYPETAFMREASRAGAICANGLSMLLHQGAVAFKIWTGTSPDIQAMRKALENGVYNRE